MVSIHDRLKRLEAYISLAGYQPRISLEQITDEDLQTLMTLQCAEHWDRFNNHPEVVAMFTGDPITVEQGARLAEIAREVMSCA